MTKVKPDGRQVRWQEHNQQRRQLIVDAAVAVLESQSPGDEVQVLAVAERAGLSRTVIYRHFDDRADLDRAVQRSICDQLGLELLSALAIDNRPQAIVQRTVDVLVRWCDAHPSLFSFIERDLAGWGPSPLAEATKQIAAMVENVIKTVVTALGAELSENDMAGLEPWVFAMIGGVFAGVRRWLGRPVRAPGTEDFIKVLAEVVWVQIDGMAQARGIDIPDEPVGDLLLPMSGTE